MIRIEEEAMAALLSVGAEWRDVRKSPRPPYFLGRELFLAPSAFATFNELRTAGTIHVGG